MVSLIADQIREREGRNCLGKKMQRKEREKNKNCEEVLFLLPFFCRPDTDTEQKDILLPSLFFPR
jgi:hypothetical protein